MLTEDVTKSAPESGAKVIHVNFGKVPKKTNSIVFACSDFRLTAGILEWCRDLGLESADEIKVPGGAKTLIERESLVIDSIITLQELHQSTQIFVIAHSDCGAYKKKGIEFKGDADAERIFHVGELLRATEVLQEVAPDLEIHLVYVNLSGVEEIEIDRSIEDPGFLIAVG